MNGIRPERCVAVVPAYNEVATIIGVVERLREQVGEVMVVDDGSIDGTAECLTDAGVTVLRNPHNLGKGASLARGFREALESGAKAVITLDADGQHRPEDIPALLEASALHPDWIVIAARQRSRDRAPPLRRFANGFADFWISWAAGYPIRDSQSGFRLYPAQVLGRLSVPHGPGRGFVFESEILIEAAEGRIYSESVAIDTLYPESARRSHYLAFRDTARIVQMVAGRLLRRWMYPSGLLQALRLLPDPRNMAGS